MASLRKRSEAAGNPGVPPIPEEQIADKELAEIDWDENNERLAREEAQHAKAGTTVRVTWGEEFYSIVPFNGFRVGPFEVTGRTLPGESITKATLRLHHELSSAAQTLREVKRTQHVAELRAQGSLK
jgi:hypothetical protein